MVVPVCLEDLLKSSYLLVCFTLPVLRWSSIHTSVISTQWHVTSWIHWCVLFFVCYMVITGSVIQAEFESWPWTRTRELDLWVRSIHLPCYFQVLLNYLLITCIVNIMVLKNYLKTSVSYKPSSSPGSGLKLMIQVYKLNSTHERHNRNATKMSTKGHGVLWPFRRHPELLRTVSGIPRLSTYTLLE